jgi:hypothetical protein
MKIRTTVMMFATFAVLSPGCRHSTSDPPRIGFGRLAAGTITGAGFKF